ncbi:NADH dehydrogenase [Campylobacter pinnipediorum]|uniref:NADH dehydrogenase n=1 Tax=Campylobacter pinnipediorum subsp. pinnipediorum TaxID=1660067 RepID=A0AAX0L9A7_9BACT|nr:NADH dehydrogenase [Campylobacter pinnipediorum]AQW82270.1 hypothetical protein CPIN17261_0220 [Campylobacter pinnipediorum subsp. pinnipediorum]AQW83947.1 hypothetical protein CPIN17262_0219 [Campylobacter pinnipediorum subsp. pinnipediorum]OPA75074.1 NADH dehydrogenase [Campylobacter pinnipediorum subsp. pinnipediorum]
MKFKEFKKAKTLSLANLLSLSNLKLANELKECEFKYISCLNDEILGSKNLIKCEIGSISYVLALLCKYTLDIKNEYFDGLDEGYLSGECSVGEEEFDELKDWMKDVKNIIIDSSFFTHPDSKMLFEFLNLFDIDIVLADGEASEIKIDKKFTELKELDGYDGSVIYQYISQDSFVKGGTSFAIASKVKDKDNIFLKAEDFELNADFILDTTLKGTIAFVPVKKVNGYNFRLVRVQKI